MKQVDNLKAYLYHKIMSNRTFIMFFAIFWVMLSHTAICNLNIPVLSFASRIGYGGVDIFMFLSGMGIYTSLYKSNGDKILDFYARRIKKLMPAYSLILTIAFITYLCLPSENIHHVEVVNYQFIADYIGNLSCVSFFQGRRTFNWYIQGIFWIYFISPILYRIVGRFRSLKEQILIWGGVLALCIPCYYSDLMKVSARLILYILGMYVAEAGIRVKDPMPIDSKYKWSLIVCSIMGIGALKYIYVYHEGWLNFFGLFFFPFVVIVPGLSYFLSCCADKIKGSFIERGISYLGRYTLGIYLLNIYIYTCLGALFQFRLVNNPIINILLLYFIQIVLAIVGGTLLEKMMNKTIQSFAKFDAKENISRGEKKTHGK